MPNAYAARMSGVELRQLRAFVAVVDTGSFTQAAAELHVSQAAVSRAVAGLEQGLGRRLLLRTTRHIALTDAGARILIRARRVLDDVASLERVAAEAPSRIRMGYAWGAFGKHTTRLQRRWLNDHPGVDLALVHSSTASAGLDESASDVAILRRPTSDPRFDTALVGSEARYAALSTDHPLARRRRLQLSDLARYPVAVDDRTGTTTSDLWPPDGAPATTRVTHGVEEWLTAIAAGQAVGVTSEATAHQNPRPGIAYRAVVDADPIRVYLAWWRDDAPPLLPELLALIRKCYASTLELS